MASPQSSTVLQWARGLRFPTLFMITAGLFVVNMLLPDPIPFVDELLFGLVTLLLANWKRRKAVDGLDPPPQRQPPPLPDDSRGR